MEAASSLILTNQTGLMINHQLPGHLPFFKIDIFSIHENSNIFIKQYISHFPTFKLKGRPLIIIMRPTASLTRC